MEQALGFDAARQRALVARGQDGDKIALAELYDTTFPIIYRWAMSATRNREEAEDITAETFERALRGLSRFESGDVPIVVWLLRIAQNVAREYQQKRVRHRAVDIENLEIGTLPSTPGVETPGDLHALIAHLTPAQREVLVLRLAGLKLREIAELRGSAEGTVKALQFAAIRNLRKVMSHEQ